MTRIGLDLNSSRVRAVSGPEPGAGRALVLDGASELPLALSLEGRHVQIGAAGLALVRKLPHFVCADFLPYLGQKKQWAAGRHRLDAARALGLVLERVQPVCTSASGMVAALPAYLGHEQVGLVTDLLLRTRLSAIATVAAPLASGLVGFARQPWVGSALVVDADGGALTVAVVTAEDGPDGGLVLDQVLPIPALSQRAWTERLINGVADRCIRLSRRDPRESSEAEQHLFHQLPAALAAYRRAQVVELDIQGRQWFQHVLLRPEELESFCAPLARQATEQVRGLLSADCRPSSLLLASAAARLPGLTTALAELLGESATINLLAEDDTATGAFELAGILAGSGRTAGHFEVRVSLPARPPRPESKPAVGRLRILDSGM